MMLVTENNRFYTKAKEMAEEWCKENNFGLGDNLLDTLCLKIATVMAHSAMDGSMDSEVYKDAEDFFKGMRLRSLK